VIDFTNGDNNNIAIPETDKNLRMAITQVDHFGDSVNLLSLKYNAIAYTIPSKRQKAINQEGY
jgi:hypothetical protein